ADRAQRATRAVRAHTRGAVVARDRRARLPHRAQRGSRTVRHDSVSLLKDSMTNPRLFLCSILSVIALAFSSCSCGPKCSVGQAMCACRDGNQCDDGAVCGADNKCVAPTFTGVTVSAANARGCEVLITESAGTAVAFGKYQSGVVGTTVRE